MLERSARFRARDPAVVFEDFDDEVVAVDLDTGSYYSLGGSAGLIWRLLDRGLDVRQVTAEIVLRYGVDEEHVLTAVTKFVDELLTERLIEPRASDAALAATRNPGDAALPDSRPWASAGFEPPELKRYTDMRDLLLLDPIHEVDEAGWPTVKPTGTSEA